MDSDDKVGPFFVCILTPFIVLEEYEVPNKAGSKAPILSEFKTASLEGSFPSKKTCSSDTLTSQTHLSSIDSRQEGFELHEEMTESDAEELDQSTRKNVWVSF